MGEERLMGTKIQPGDFDCYAAAEDDEPMFVLLARDPIAPRLVAAWATARLNDALAGARPVDERERQKIQEARDCARSMMEWREVRRRDPEGPAA
jgi:hypothetical protein